MLIIKYHFQKNPNTSKHLAFHISTHQRADSILNSIIRDLELGQISQNYCLNKGILCISNHRNTPKIIYLSQSLTDLVIKYYHVSPVGIYLGVLRTKLKLQNILSGPLKIRMFLEKYETMKHAPWTSPLNVLIGIINIHRPYPSHRHNPHRLRWQNDKNKGRKHHDTGSYRPVFEIHLALPRQRFHQFDHLKVKYSSKHWFPENTNF